MALETFRMLFLATLFRMFVLAVACVGLLASHTAWPIVVLTLLGAWAVTAPAEWLARRNDRRLLLSPRAKRAKTLGEALLIVALAMVIIFEVDGIWWFVGLIVAFVSGVCFRYGARELEGRLDRHGPPERTRTAS